MLPRKSDSSKSLEVSRRRCRRGPDETGRCGWAGRQRGCRGARSSEAKESACERKVTPEASRPRSQRLEKPVGELRLTPESNGRPGEGWIRRAV